MAAMLASTQFPATTDTVRHGLSAGRPVRGSTRWWRVESPRRQRRTVVLEVASAPPCRAITSPSLPGSALLSSATRTRQPSCGGYPAVAMSPPIPTSTLPPPIASCAASAARSLASAFPLEPRSSSTPDGNRTVRERASNWTACQPGIGWRRSSSGLVRSASRSKSRSYPMRRIAPPTVGSASPPLSLAPRRASSIARASKGLTSTGRPGRAFRRLSSLSGRKRLYVRSTSSTTFCSWNT